MTFKWEYQEQSGSEKIEANEILIGRAGGEGKWLILDHDDKISRRHARIWLEDDDWWLEDLGSARGTHVNGRPLDEEEAWGLTEKDIIIIGETTIRISGMKYFKTMNLRPPLEPDRD